MARQEANRVLQLDPTIHEAELLRAEANKGLGDYASFLHDVNAVIQLRPRRNFDTALNTRAWFFATCRDPFFRDGPQALKDAKLACKLSSWKDADLIDTLAAAAAECGDFEVAVQYQQQAMTMKGAAGLRDPQKRLALYRQHQPYRESQ